MFTAKILLIINEASYNHFNIEAIYKYGRRHNIFVQTLYLHTNSKSNLSASSKIEHFYYKSGPDFVFLLIQPATDRELTNPDETYFVNITRVCNLLPVVVHYLTPFKPEYSYLSKNHEKKFLDKLSAKESDFFKIFSTTQGDNLQSPFNGDIIAAMFQYVAKNRGQTRALELHRPGAPRAVLIGRPILMTLMV
jgi:hypothetical protein